MSANRPTVFVLLTAAVVASPAAMYAQEWRVGVDAGRVRSSIAPVASQAATLAAGIGYEDPATAFRLSAGIPASADSIRWGSVAAAKRLAVTQRGLTAGVDLSGSFLAFQQRITVAGQPGGGLLGPAPVPGRTSSENGRAMAAQVLPTVAYQRGRVQVQARAGISYYDASTREDLRDRVVNVGELQLVFTPVAAFAVAPVLRRLAPRGEDAATFAGASLLMASGPLKLWSSAGVWSGVAAPGAERTAWSVGGDMRVASRVSLTASARRDGLDPLYRTPAQTSWSVGAAVVLGHRPRAAESPTVTRIEKGLATIRVRASLFSSPPRVGGDFNGWKPAPMTRDGSSWTFTVPATPGVYNYAFVDADGTWYVPEGVPGRKDDGFGGHVAVVVVR